MMTLSVPQAQQQIQDAMLPITQSEKVTLNNALDRILAIDIIAPVNVPAFDNSAMDGYAFCAQDLTSKSQLSIVGNAFAGHPYQNPLETGQAIRITTGAKMPEHSDTVLPQEFAVLTNENTLDMHNIVTHPGQHRRLAGEDIHMGDIVLVKGCRLNPAELGLLASLGFSEVVVQRQLRVAIFSTGDELHSQGELKSGCIFDSNRITLHAMLTRFGADVIDLGVLADDLSSLETALKNIAPQVDAIITSGGISSGTADYTKMAMQQLGETSFLTIQMRPGRQFAFGKIVNRSTENTSNTYLFGLPGNPVAVMVCFYFFVRPALQVLNGAQVTMPPQINAITTQAISKKVGRTEFQRGICSLSSLGQLRVSLTGEQGSGILSSMSHANCLIVLNPEQADISAGEIVKIILFDGLTSY